MSERIVDDPSLHGWVDLGDDKWGWEGGLTTGHIQDGDNVGEITTWDGGEWTPDPTVLVKGGKVGIGPVDASTSAVGPSTLVVSGNSNAGISVSSPGNNSFLYMGKAGDSTPDGVVAYYNNLKEMRFSTDGTERLTIDSAGNVGIGMTPEVVTAKEQLAEWKASFDARLKAEPKADKKAVTLEITDDAFEVLPTEEALAEWMETRAAGDKLQVAGNGSFSGELTTRLYNLSGQNIWTKGGSGIRFNSSTIFPLDGNGDITSTGPDFGSSDRKFSNAHFSETVYANAFVGDGSGLTGVGGGLPDGDFTHNGKITATDFIATSDERVKDNITTAPVGLIDSLKGREWDWKESGEKGSGVVAQELEEVLPHLVHTDDEGMKSVAYNGLVAYLIEEVKALRAEIKEIKNG